MPQPSENNCDIKLPGYTLEKRIGSGGYGEVWLAHAPGGLTKAVKFIFGFYNEKRAASELRSLEKIKAVRHPFLLSLERIEVLEGRLVIVTELADGSLKDRFDQSVEQGLTGIPREELLGYLRDSADALDYLSLQHSLQHLDVKPENLLLLAGHVKVADFGLVKEIQDTQASLVGGMTPLYSAPEVFQGLPTRHSDQYSLAVLYQEMLTGELPFNGTTAAELTLQHMHDEPNLGSLPMADRYVLARALSKNPQQRYDTCREFVQALLNIEKTDDTTEGVWNVRPSVKLPTERNTQTPEHKKSRPGTMTQVFEDDLKQDQASVSKSMMIPMPSAIEGESPELAALDLQAAGFEPTPTLVIGIGGTAGHVLTQLRKRMNNRFGNKSSVPSLQLLLMDTDKTSLLEATHGTVEGGLTSEETLAMQLRRPQEYRDHSKRLLGWLSRRWLYNIPRSLRTEGLRPLGRLAFADHARRTIQRIRLSLMQAMDENSITESSEQTGCAFRGEGVRVIVVASVSGGTGSGISIDMGYAVRSLLEKMGIEQATTTGIFLHSTGRDSRFCDLAKVNAFSWFKEYNHFARPEGHYPGDEASGLPAMPAGTPPFDSAYFLPLGDGLNVEQLRQSSDAVAQYLYLDTFTSAHTFFEASREGLLEHVAGNPALRTFGLHEESAASPQALAEVAQRICQCVVFGWSGESTDFKLPSDYGVDRCEHDQETTSISNTSQIVCGAPRAVAQLQLNIEGISANARLILEGQFGSDTETLLTQLLAEASLQEANDNGVQVIKLVDTLFAPAPGTDASSGSFVCGRRLDAIVSHLGMKLAGDVQRWLLHRLDEGQERLAGTRQAAQWFADHFGRVEADAQRLAQGVGRKLVEMVNQTNGGNAPRCTNLELANRYFRLRLDLSALQATGHLVSMLQSELKSVREAIVEFGRHLRHLAETLGNDENSAEVSASDQQTHANQDPICQKLLTRLGSLTAKVDQQMQVQFIDQQGGLFQTVMGNSKMMAEMLTALNSIALQQVTLAARELSSSGSQVLDHQSLTQYMEQATPSLLQLGGINRQLVVLPQMQGDEKSTAQVRDVLGVGTSLLTGIEGNLVACSEVGQLPLARVAVDLIACRRDYAEFADRVHTRNDISWKPLIDPANAPADMAVSQFVTQVL